MIADLACAKDCRCKAASHEAAAADMNGFDDLDDLALIAVGARPMPTGPVGYDPTAAVFDPVFLRSDCNCRGGEFIEVPGAPQNSYCLPPIHPTGKYYDFRTKGCLPAGVYREPILPPSWCDYQGHNLCLYGGIALGVFLLLNAVTKPKAKKGRR